MYTTSLVLTKHEQAIVIYIHNLGFVCICSNLMCTYNGKIYETTYLFNYVSIIIP